MRIKKFISQNAAWVVFFALCALFSALSPNFLTKNNIIIILRQVSVNGIAAVGLSIILISGGIDLSTGSQAAVSGMICALLMVKGGWGMLPASIVAVLVTALACGLLNGLGIAFTGMPALIATLGTMNIGRGAAYLLNGGYTVYGLPDGAKILGQSSVFGIPLCVIVMILTLVVGHFIINHTTYGRMIFAIGANEEAARLSGIPVKLIKVSTYVVGSLFICFAGIVLMSRLNSGIPTAGTDIYIEILAGCIIGGISSTGGSGSIFRMIGGIFVMTVISNGMNIAGISEFWQYVAKGAILMFSVGVDSYRTRKAQQIKNNVIRSSGSDNGGQKVMVKE